MVMGGFIPDKFFKPPAIFISFHYLVIVMDRHMLRNCKKNEVFPSIVKRVAVDMVNVFTLLKRPSKFRANYMPMLQNSPATIRVFMGRIKNLRVSVNNYPVFSWFSSYEMHAKTYLSPLHITASRAMKICFVGGKEVFAAFYTWLNEIPLPRLTFFPVYKVDFFLFPFAILKHFESMIWCDINSHREIIPNI